jgi:hypothetical protein
MAGKDVSGLEHQGIPTTSQIPPAAWNTLQQGAPEKAPSLEAFLNEVRSSCGEHASRKGYISTTGRNVAGEVTSELGLARNHALGEIYYKWLEFQRTPRRVVAVKIAGWAWRLWTTVDE